MWWSKCQGSDSPEILVEKGKGTNIMAQFCLVKVKWRHCTFPCFILLVTMFVVYLRCAAHFTHLNLLWLLCSIFFYNTFTKWLESLINCEIRSQEFFCQFERRPIVRYESCLRGANFLSSFILCIMDCEMNSKIARIDDLRGLLESVIELVTAFAAAGIFLLQ